MWWPFNRVSRDILPAAEPRGQDQAQYQVKAEMSPVNLSAKVWSLRPRRDPNAPCAIFPFPGFSMSTSLCSQRSWGKTEAYPAAPLPPTRPPHLSFCLLGFFYGRASNAWPLPCISLHVHVHTQQNKTRAACDGAGSAAQIFLCGECSSLNLRLCQLSAAITAFWFILCKTHLYCNPIKQQPQRVRNHLCLVEIFIQLFSSSPCCLVWTAASCASSGSLPCDVVWQAVIWCTHLPHLHEKRFALPAAKLHRRLLSI